MKLMSISIVMLFSQVCFAYSCEDRVTFMYLFKAQTLITQKVTSAESLKASIGFCQDELKSFKDEAKKSINDCFTSKIDLVNDDKLIEEMYKDDRDSVMIEEKKFAHDLVEKYKKDLDLNKLCRDYGKGSPLIKSKMTK